MKFACVVPLFLNSKQIKMKNNSTSLRLLPNTCDKYNCGPGGFKCECCSDSPRDIKPKIRRFVRRKLKQIDKIESKILED